MARFPADVLQRLRRKPAEPFTRSPKDGMDLLSTNGYDMSSTGLDQLRTDVDALVDRLRPGAVDAYSEEVLDAWLGARELALFAQLDGEREERQAVAEALIGIARQEVARRKSSYEADLTRLREAREALEVTRWQLTGSREVGPFAESPNPIDVPFVGSTLGPVDTSPDWDPDTRDRRDPEERARHDIPDPDPGDQDPAIPDPRDRHGDGTGGEVIALGKGTDRRTDEE